MRSCRCYRTIIVVGTLLCRCAKFGFFAIIVIGIEVDVQFSHFANVVSRKDFVRNGSGCAVHLRLYMVVERIVFKHIGREIAVSVVCTDKQIGEETRTNRVVGTELVGCRKRIVVVCIAVFSLFNPLVGPQINRMNLVGSGLIFVSIIEFVSRTSRQLQAIAAIIHIELIVCVPVFPIISRRACIETEAVAHLTHRVNADNGTHRRIVASPRIGYYLNVLNVRRVKTLYFGCVGYLSVVYIDNCCTTSDDRIAAFLARQQRNTLENVVARACFCQRRTHNRGNKGIVSYRHLGALRRNGYAFHCFCLSFQLQSIGSEGQRNVAPLVAYTRNAQKYLCVGRHRELKRSCLIGYCTRNERRVAHRKRNNIGVLDRRTLLVGYPPTNSLLRLCNGRKQYQGCNDGIQFLHN